MKAFADYAIAIEMKSLKYMNILIIIFSILIICIERLKAGKFGISILSGGINIPDSVISTSTIMV